MGTPPTSGCRPTASGPTTSSCPACCSTPSRPGNAQRLAEHLAASPDRQFTNLDCHDGIPVRPDLDGILTPGEMADLAERVQAQGGNVNRILSDAHAEAGDVHQLNCTYYSALGEDDERYLAARAIQLFARGVPQIYYVGLLAGANDHEAVERTGEGRAINRHDYTVGRDRSARSIGRSSDASSTWSGFGTRTRRSTASSWSKPTTTIPFALRWTATVTP